jgi:hypothetical protein
MTMAQEPRKRAAASSAAGSLAGSVATSGEPQKERKKKKKRKQDHEECAGTGTLDQLFLGFLFMTICLIAGMWYLWKVRPSHPGHTFGHAVIT